MSRSKSKYITVAEFITRAIHRSGKAQHEIANECGWPKPNMVTMLKQGRTKLPLDKVGPLAKSLEVDPVYLLSLVMFEYMPDTYQAVEDVLQGMMLNEHEREIIEAYRELTEGKDASVELHVGVQSARIEVDGATIILKKVPAVGPTSGRTKGGAKGGSTVALVV